MIDFILKNPRILLISVILGLLAILGKTCSEINKLEEALESKQAYISAMEDYQQGIGTTLEMTREELSRSRDSVNKFLWDYADQKGYAKTVQRLEFVEEVFTKVDTIITSDTIFRDGVKFDTVVSNGEYYTCRVSGEYPCNLVIEPTVKSNLVLLTRTEEYYTGKPAKTKLGVALRKLFCRKKWRERYVTDVEDLNPYIEVIDKRIIQLKEE